MYRILIRLPDDLGEQLKRAAFERRWSVNRAVNIAVFHLLKQLEEDEAK